MSKQGYLDMCEALGSEPLPEEMPVDPSDLAYETVLALNCYGMLSENWSSMGTYMGKSISELSSIMTLLKVTDIEEEYVIETVTLLDSIVSKDIARKQKQQAKK